MSTPKTDAIWDLCIIAFSTVLVIKEHINSGLFCGFSAHLLQVALELVCSLHKIEHICTKKQTILLEHPTCFCHLLKRRRHHFEIVIMWRSSGFLLMDLISAHNLALQLEWAVSGVCASILPEAW